MNSKTQPSQSAFTDSFKGQSSPKPASTLNTSSPETADNSSANSSPESNHDKELIQSNNNQKTSPKQSKMGQAVDTANKIKDFKNATPEERDQILAKEAIHKGAGAAGAAVGGAAGKQVAQKATKTAQKTKIGKNITDKVSRKIKFTRTVGPWVMLVALLPAVIGLSFLVMFLTGGDSDDSSSGSSGIVNPEVNSPSGAIPGQIDLLDATQMLPLYKSAAEKYGIPWQSIAALGQVLTKHGKENPFLATGQEANTSTPRGLFLLDPQNPKVTYTALLPDNAEQIEFVAAWISTKIEEKGYSPESLAKENTAVRDRVWSEIYSSLPIAWPSGGFVGTGYAPITGTFALGEGGRIFVIGDSLSVGITATREFTSFFNSSLPTPIIDGLVSRRIPEGTAALATFSPKSGDVVIAVLGTNNYSDSESALMTKVTNFMVSANGARVLWVSTYLPSRPAEQAVFLKVLRAVGQIYPNLQIVDWGAEATSKKIPVDSLGVHPTSYGTMASFVITALTPVVVKNSVATTTPSTSTPPPTESQTAIGPAVPDILVPAYGEVPPGAIDNAPGFPAGNYKIGSLPGPIEGTAVNGDQVAVPAPAIDSQTLPPPPLVFPVTGYTLIDKPGNFGITNPRPNGRWHHGFDIMAPKGVPVVAACAGKVIDIQNYVPGKSGGNWITIVCADNNRYGYGHLDTMVVVKGQTVSEGQQLGTVGNTGTGAYHLHFSINERRVIGPYVTDSKHPTAGPYIINVFEALKGSVSLAAPYNGTGSSSEMIISTVLLQARAYGGLSPEENRPLPNDADLNLSLRASNSLIGFADPATVESLLTLGVPQDVAVAIAANPASCPEYTPSLQVAQAYVESGFRTDAVSSANALGVSQFLPGTWETWGIDADGDGTANIWDPDDAILAKANFMCHLVKLAKDRGKTEVMKEALRYYNCGPAWENNPSRCKNGWAYATKIVDLADTKFNLSSQVPTIPSPTQS